MADAPHAARTAGYSTARELPFPTRSEWIASRLVACLHNWALFKELAAMRVYSWALTAGYYHLYHVALLPGDLLANDIRPSFLSMIGAKEHSPLYDAEHSA